MCLYIDRITTQQELEKEFDTRTFYKLFILNKNFIQTPYFDFKIMKPGLVAMPDALTLDEITDESMVMVQGRAFHVRTTESALKLDKFWVKFFNKADFSKGEVISLPVIVQKKDIICFGLQDQVAVKSYNISEECWSLINWSLK